MSEEKKTRRRLNPMQRAIEHLQAAHEELGKVSISEPSCCFAMNARAEIEGVIGKLLPKNPVLNAGPEAFPEAPTPGEIQELEASVSHEKDDGIPF